MQFQYLRYNELIWVLSLLFLSHLFFNLFGNLRDDVRTMKNWKSWALELPWLFVFVAVAMTALVPRCSSVVDQGGIFDSCGFCPTHFKMFPSWGGNFLVSKNWWKSFCNFLRVFHFGEENLGHRDATIRLLLREAGITAWNLQGGLQQLMAVSPTRDLHALTWAQDGPTCHRNGEFPRYASWPWVHQNSLPTV